MRHTLKTVLGSLLLALAAAPLGAQEAPNLDKMYGVPSQPAYIKHYEADKTGKVILNPYLQAASKEFPAVLEVKSAPYNWVIDVQGRVSIMPEKKHPLGRTYEKGFHRPEDDSDRKPGTSENFGHVSSLGGAPGRISGEILYDKATNLYTINNKSGRYTKHNSDRTPEQLVNSANLIREVVDTQGVAWGPTMYLLEYAPETIREEKMKDPNLAYDDPKKKSRPHVVVMPGAPASFKPEKPIEMTAGGGAAAAPATDKPAETAAPKADKDKAAASTAAAAAPAAAADAPKAAEPAKKAKKPKAAQNDDPS